MSKQYNIHSVRVDDEVWAQVKTSSTSVNQLLRKALDLPWVQTRRVGDDNEIRSTVVRDTVVPGPRVERAPLLRPGEKKQ
jgi:hypothetical protein